MDLYWSRVIFRRSARAIKWSRRGLNAIDSSFEVFWDARLCHLRSLVVGRDVLDLRGKWPHSFI